MGGAAGCQCVVDCRDSTPRGAAGRNRGRWFPGTQMPARQLKGKQAAQEVYCSDVQSTEPAAQARTLAGMLQRLHLLLPLELPLPLLLLLREPALLLLILLREVLRATIDFTYVCSYCCGRN